MIRKLEVIYELEIKYISNFSWSSEIPVLEVVTIHGQSQGHIDF